MWGGFDLKSEGAIFSLIILFFSLLSGLNFRNQHKTIQNNVNSNGGLSDEDRDLVLDAINQNKKIKETTVNDPKVIIVKQEKADKEKQSSLSDPTGNQLNINPYNASNNPTLHIQLIIMKTIMMMIMMNMKKMNMKKMSGKKINKKQFFWIFKR